MMTRSSSFLGLAIADRTIGCAEVGGGPEAVTLRHTAEFEMPAELSAANAESTGRELAAFLRSHGFSVSRAVVGVPARWLLAHEREIPPAEDDSTNAMLRLQAERLSAGDNQEMIFDYAGQSDPSQSRHVLLVGMLRSRMHEIEHMLESAGLSVVAMTSSALALSSVNPGNDAGPMLLLSRQGVELVFADEQAPRMLRHLPVGPLNGHGAASINALAAELRRVLTMSQASSQGSANGMVLWDGVGLTKDQVTELSGRAGMAIRPGQRLLPPGTNTTKAGDPYAVATALATAGARRLPLPVDFAHSRLAPLVKPRISRRTRWTIALVTTVVVALAGLYFDVSRRERELNELNGKLKSMEAHVKTAENTISRVDYGRGFFDRRPPMLECLREVTLAFRGDENIWATSFSTWENRKAQLIGKATDQRSVLALLDRLKKIPKLGEVKLLDMRDAPGRTREVSFSMNFVFSTME